jgi:hypothetical protein
MNLLENHIAGMFPPARDETDGSQLLSNGGMAILKFHPATWKVAIGYPFREIV